MVNLLRKIFYCLFDFSIKRYQCKRCYKTFIQGQEIIEGYWTLDYEGSRRDYEYTEMCPHCRSTRYIRV